MTPWTDYTPLEPDADDGSWAVGWLLGMALLCVALFWWAGGGGR